MLLIYDFTLSQPGGLKTNKKAPEHPIFEFRHHITQDEMIYYYIIITQIYFNSSKYTFPVLALHKDRIGRDMNPSEFVY